MIYCFSKEERENICKLFENGMKLRSIGKIFECSRAPIRRILIEILGEEKYKEIAKEHLSERSRKMGKLPKTQVQRDTCRRMGEKWMKEHPEEHRENARKMGKLPKTEKQIEHCRKMGLKYGPINGPEIGRKTGPINIKYAQEWHANNHTYISRPEAIFYITCLSKNFWLKDIIPQYYIKEIKHRVDFAVPSQKLLFEVDGDRWYGHSGNKEMDKERLERDAEVDKWAKDNGWTIFRYNDEKMRKLGVRL